MPYFAITLATCSELSGTWSEQGGATDILDAIKFSDTKRQRLDGDGVTNPNVGEFNGSVSAATNILLMGSTNPLSNPPTSNSGAIDFASLPAGFRVTSLFMRIHANDPTLNFGTTTTFTPTKDGITCAEAKAISYVGGNPQSTCVWQITPTPVTNSSVFQAQYGCNVSVAGTSGLLQVSYFYIFGTYEIVNYAVSCSEQEIAPGTTANVCRLETYDTTPSPGFEAIDVGDLRWWNLGFYWLWQPYSPGPGWVEAAEPDDYGWWQSLEEFGGGAIVRDEQSEAPKAPRTQEELEDFDTSETLLGAGGAVTFKNKIVYARGGYTRGTDKPTIGIFDGISDRTLVSIPDTSDGNTSYAVMSIQKSRGSIYVCTWDPGATPGTSDFFGRVFRLDVDGASLEQIGADFPDEETPYAVTWHNGRLWCVTHIGDDSFHTTEKGKLYSILPEAETTWTEEYDFVNQSGILGGTWLISYGGELFVGTTGNANTTGKVFSFAADGAISTEVNPVLGTSSENNGFLCATVFEDAIYTAYYSSNTLAMAIYKWDGTEWTFPYVATTGYQVPIVGLFVGGHGSDKNIYAIGGQPDSQARLIRSEDGATWSDVSYFLPGDQKGIPMFAEVSL